MLQRQRRERSLLPSPPPPPSGGAPTSLQLNFDARRIERKAGQRAKRGLERERARCRAHASAPRAARRRPRRSARAARAPANSSGAIVSTAAIWRTHREAGFAGVLAPVAPGPRGRSRPLLRHCAASARQRARVLKLSTGDDCRMSSALPCAIPPCGSIRRTSPTRSRSASFCASAPPSGPAPMIAMKPRGGILPA